MICRFLLNVTETYYHSVIEIIKDKKQINIKIKIAHRKHQPMTVPVVLLHQITLKPPLKPISLRTFQYNQNKLILKI